MPTLLATPRRSAVVVAKLGSQAAAGLLPGLAVAAAAVTRSADVH